jgi:carboxymethylenebutenolidase
MQVQRQDIGLMVGDSLMRVYVASPQPAGQYPGILFYSDIYQLGAPITRLADRLAGYGYVVAAPEIFHRLEPIGTVIEPNSLGRLRGNDNARRTAIAAYDADAIAVLDWLQTQAQVTIGEIGSLGFCIGGHLALRAALQPGVKLSVCCYPTGVHNGKLGQDRADTLERLGEIKGAVLTLFGSLDPQVPLDAREQIIEALDRAGVAHKTLLYDADHTFMRDDGYRYDPVASDGAWQAITESLCLAFDG